MIPRRRFTLALACAAVAVAQQSRAIVYVWDGTAGSNWFSQVTVDSAIIDTSWTPQGFPSGGNDASFLTSNDVAFLTNSVSIGNLALAATGASLTIQGNGGVGDVALATSSINNAGTITLGTFSGGYTTSISASNSGVNFVNSGTLNSGSASTGGLRRVTANMVNIGLFTADAVTVLNGTFVNTGAVKSTGNYYSLEGSSNFAQRSGSMDIFSGGFNVSGTSTFEFGGTGAADTGGTINGTVVLANSTLVTFGTTGFGSFRFDQNSNQTGNIGQHTSLLIQGNGSIGDVTLNSSAASNAGVITLQSRDGGYLSSLQLGPAGTGTMTNIGTINTLNGPFGGLRSVIGNLLNNNGTFNNSAGTSLSVNVVNRGFFNDTAGAVSVISGSDFAQRSGTLVIDPSAGFNVINSTFEFGGTGSSETGGSISGTIDLFNSTLKTFGTVGAGAFRVNQTSNLSGNVGPNTSILIQGNGSYGDVALNAASFTNAGAITLQSRDGGYNDFLTVGPSGTGTLINTGSINSLAGTGGGRIISGNVVSSGAFNNSGSTTLTGTFVNTGAVNVTGGGVTVASASDFAQRSGSINLAGGAMAISNSTFEFGGASAGQSGGAITGTIVFYNSTLKTFGTSGVGSFRIDQSSSQSGDVGPNTSILVESNGAFGDVSLNTGSFQNSGVITVDSREGGFNSTLSIGLGSGTLTNTGTINTLQGVGGIRTISGTVLNSGVYNNSGGDTRLFGSFVNTGAFNDTAGTVTLLSGQDFVQRSGTLTIGTAAAMAVNSSTFEFGGTGGTETGGTITGTVVLHSSTLKTFGTTGVGAFRIDQNSVQSGNIGPNTLITVEANGAAGDVTLSTGPAINAGVVTMDSREASFNTFLNIDLVGGGTLTNTGTINSLNGVGGIRSINGNIISTGVFNSTADTRIAGKYTNTGAFNVSAGGVSIQLGADFAQRSGTITLAGGAMSVNGSTIEFGGGAAGQTGGTIAGTVVLRNSTLKTFGTTGVGAFRIDQNSAQSGNIGPSTLITVEANGPSGDVTLTTGPTTNAGIITMDSREAAFNTFLNIDLLGGGILTNTGTINSLNGVGGARFINGNIVSSGIFNSTADTRISSNFTNTGAFNVSAGGVSIQSSGDFAQRSGTITLAGGAMSVNSSTFEFGGTGAGQTGGTITGTVVLNSSALKTFNTTGTGSFRIDHNSTQTGIIGPNTTILVEANGSAGDVGLTTDENPINNGSINLDNREAAFNTFLTFGDGNGVLTNNGSLTTYLAVGGNRFINGSIINNGLLAINTNTIISGTVTNHGSFDVSGSTNFNIASGLSNINGTTLVAGTFAIHSPASLTIAGAPALSTNQANVTLDGPGASFAVFDSIIRNDGQLALSNGRVFTAVAGIDGTGNLSLSGSGTALTADYVRQNSLVVSNSAVAIRTGSNSASKFNALSITGTGSLDLGDNDLIVNYTGASPAATIRGYLKSAYNAGAWNAAGLASSAAHADASHLTALGYGDAADLGITTLDGQPIIGHAVIAKYTYYGDASLDGKVDLGNDFNLFLDGFINHAAGWEEGDFNYDDVVNMADFKLFLDGYAGQGNSLGALSNFISGTDELTVSQKTSLLSVVPEPSSIAIVSAVACVFATKRRRRRHA